MPQKSEETLVFNRLSVEVRGPSEAVLRKQALDLAAVYFGVPADDPRLTIITISASVVYYDVTGNVPQLYKGVVLVSLEEKRTLVSNPAPTTTSRPAAPRRHRPGTDGGTVIHGRFSPSFDESGLGEHDDELDDDADDWDDNE